MSNNSLFFIAIISTTLFIVSSILGGFQFDDYDPISQYISETMAIGTPHGKKLRYFGYIPSGILLIVFSFIGYKRFPKSHLTKIGFIGLGLFYGFSTIIVGIFPCDIGCNKELIDPSISQLIHNFVGLLTYLFVPISIVFINLGLWKSKNYSQLFKIGIICAFISIIFISLLISNNSSSYIGLYQRIIEVIFIFFIISCAISIKKMKVEVR